VANVAVDMKDNIAAYSTNMVANLSRCSFIHDLRSVTFAFSASVAPATPRITAKEAVAVAERHWDGKSQGVSKLAYFVKEAGALVLTYAIQVRNGIDPML
jgi:hypothetical protein